MSTARFLTAASLIGIAVAALPTAAAAQGTPITTSPQQATEPGSSTTSAGVNDAAEAPNGEIVVTAQRRAERQVDVPISITALSSQQLETSNVQNLPDIQKVTPSLRFDNQTGFFQPSIRGIGTGITTSGGGSNVGIYIDGFYSPNPVAADLQLTKVSSIQVLKGPQGTLFGHNTTGGAILITTAEPSTTPEVDLKASYGSFNAQKFQGYATFGIAPNVAMDVEGVYAKGNGWVTNIVDNDDHVGAYENWSVRAGLKVDLGSVSVLGRYQHSNMNDPTGQMLASNVDTSINPTTGQPWGVQTFTGFPGFGTIYTTDPDHIAANQKRYIRTKSDVAQLTVKADLGFANLASYSQYRKEVTHQSEDLDQTALPIFQIGIDPTDETWSQEFLLTSKPGPRLQWTAGFFFFSNKDTWIINIDPGSFFGAVTPGRLGGSGTTTQSYAGFIDGTYQFGDKFFLTAGVRYSHDTVKDAYWNTSGLASSICTRVGIPGLVNTPPPPLPDSNGCPGPRDASNAVTLTQTPGGVVPVPDISSNHLTPRVVLRYKPTDQSSIYASYTKGYKAAILDVGGSCQDGPNFACNAIQPEDIDAFEIGYKFDNHRLSFEASAFYYNYKNLQISEYLGEAQAYIINAAKSEIYGIDAQLNYRFSDHFQLSAGAAWTHGRYKTFGGETVIDPQTGLTTVAGAPIYATCAGATGAVAAASCGNPLTYAYVDNTVTLHDQPMQHVPEFTASISPRVTTGQTAHGEFSLAGNFYYTSSFYFGPVAQFKQPGYATLDLRAQWDSPNHRLMAAIYGTNVTNERYRTQVQYNGFGIGASWSQPASWGVEVGAKF